VKFEAAGDGIKSTADTVAADGTTTHTEYTADYDGKDYPLKGTKDADTVSLKRVDANSTVRTDKKAGKVVRTYTRKLSADGKTMTTTITGTNEQGQTINNTVLLERQERRARALGLLTRRWWRTRAPSVSVPYGRGVTKPSSVGNASTGVW
jgi:hypothetical protein